MTILEITAVIGATSTFGLVIIAIYASRQVGIMQEDVRLRNERAAKEQAIVYASRYLADCTRLHNLWYAACKKSRVVTYEGQWGNCSIESMPKEFFASWTSHQLERIEETDSEDYELAVANEQESIAAAFVSGIADEQLGFELIGRSFVNSAKRLYPLICVGTEKGLPYYSSLRILVPLWSDRLAKRALMEEKELLEQGINAIADKSISPIGKK